MSQREAQSFLQTLETQGTQGERFHSVLSASPSGINRGEAMSREGRDSGYPLPRMESLTVQNFSRSCPCPVVHSHSFPPCV